MNHELNSTPSFSRFLLSSCDQGETRAAGDGVPPMSALGEGAFSAKGMADAFEHAVGWPMPTDVTVKEGSYKVSNEKDFGGRNRSFHTASFLAPPERVLKIAESIEETWRGKYGTDPDVSILRETATHPFKGYQEAFTSGSVELALNETYASYKLLAFKIALDPATGVIELSSYRGTEDSPADR